MEIIDFMCCYKRQNELRYYCSECISKKDMVTVQRLTDKK